MQRTNVDRREVTQSSGGGRAVQVDTRQWRSSSDRRQTYRSDERVRTPTGVRVRENVAPRQRQIRTIPDQSPQVRTQHYSRDRDNARTHKRWVRNWRDNNRYDWRRYRDRHRSTFRIGIYYDPFGSIYRRYSIGSFMYPNYYRSNYWINDPWQYRLPPVYGPYRWVRYYDDALLIDTWTGEVVDVIYNFFW